MKTCSCRDRCMVSCRTKTGITMKTRKQLDIPCGFEMAGTVEKCPKRKRLEGGE